MKWLFRIFLVLYALAFFAYICGTYGLFGVEPGPLAGIFLVPLGMPWLLLLDLAPEPAWPYLSAAAPAVNLLILGLLQRRTKEGE
jgi:hypothetical protein